jgi:hypothetical protein
MAMSSRVAPALERFRRCAEAPTLKPDALVEMLGKMTNEVAPDVTTLRLLSSRFKARVEEFFPPQIMSTVGHFSAMSYCDDNLEQALVGRLDDVVQVNPSSKRVRHLMYYMSTLRLNHPTYLELVLPALRNISSKTKNSLPFLLQNLADLRVYDELAVDMLATQGYLHNEELGLGHTARMVDALGRLDHPYPEYLEIIKSHASKSESKSGSIIDEERVFMYSALARFGENGAAAACAKLLAKSSQLTSLAPSLLSNGVRDKKVLTALGDQFETISEFAPHALYAYAALGGQPEVITLLMSKPAFISRADSFSAQELVDLTTAACLVVFQEPSLASKIPWNSFLHPLERVYRQLDLPGRRTFLDASIFLTSPQSFANSKDTKKKDAKAKGAKSAKTKAVEAQAKSMEAAEALQEKSLGERSLAFLEKIREELVIQPLPALNRGDGSALQVGSELVCMSDEGENGRPQMFLQPGHKTLDGELTLLRRFQNHLFVLDDVAVEIIK